MTTKTENPPRESKKRKEKFNTKETDGSNTEEKTSSDSEETVTSPPRKFSRQKSGPKTIETEKMAAKMELDPEKFAQLLSMPVVTNAMQKALGPMVEEKIKGIREDVDTLKIKQEKLDKVVKDKEGRLKLAEEKLDNIEQLMKKNKLKITGIPEEEGEDLPKKAHGFIINILKVKMEPDSILYAFRLGKKETGKARPFLIEFATFRHKQDVYRARIQLSKRKEGEKIFINEDLTLDRGKLLFECRKQQKAKKILSCWTMGGMIFIKSLDGNVSQIRKEKDLQSTGLSWAERAAQPAENEHI